MNTVHIVDTVHSLLPTAWVQTLQERHAPPPVVPAAGRQAARSLLNGAWRGCAAGVNGSTRALE